MLDLPRLNRIRLSPRSFAQRLYGTAVLMPNYALLPGVRIEIEHVERIPRESVIFAMNHTDRYNYFPFMYRMWKTQERFMTVWVKGKYYEHPLVGMFMELTNNLPTVSRGYIITKDFILTMGRRPNDEEYEKLRAAVNADATPIDSGAREVDLSGVPPELLKTPRNILGVDFDPASKSYASAINQVFSAMMRRFVDLNRRSLELGLDLLVFPQGTRSIRLSRGRIGMMEIALRYKKTVVPVGCNGSDLVYPGSSPIAKAGRITYRIGDPISYSELSEFYINEDFEPFSPEAEHAYRDKFQGAVNLVMERINGLLDPRYQFDEALQSRGVQGTARFL